MTEKSTERVKSWFEPFITCNKDLNVKEGEMGGTCGKHGK